MFIAKEKIKSNIGEYIIYMFHIEDLIRASKFDNLYIEDNIINKYKVDAETKEEIKNWYIGLANLMLEEKITKKGHLSFLTNKINEVFEFHLFMLESHKHEDYKQIYNSTKLEISEFQQLHSKENNIVLLLTTALYGYSLLRLQKKEISNSTSDSIKKFAILLNKLSEKFKMYELGEGKVF